MLTIPLLGLASLYDLRTRQIHNEVVIVGLIVALASAAALGWDPLGWSVAGALVGFVAMLPLYNWKLMGGGDVKLMAVSGARGGFPGILLAVPLSLAIGGVAVATLLCSGTIKTGDKIPFGPILSVAGIVSYFWADWIFASYASLFAG